MAWSYFGNAAQFNTPSAWVGLPNLSSSDQKILGSFAHGHVYLLNGGGVVQDDNMKFRIARIAVKLFGSPLSLQKFLQVGVHWNSESNLWDSVRQAGDAVGDLAKADVNLIFAPTSSVTGKEVFTSKDFGKDRQGLSDATKLVSDVLPSGGLKTVITGKSAFGVDSFHDKKLGDFAQKASQVSGAGTMIAISLATAGLGSAAAGGSAAAAESTSLAAGLESVGGVGGAAGLIAGAVGGSPQSNAQNQAAMPPVGSGGCAMFFIPPLVGLFYLFSQLI